MIPSAVARKSQQELIQEKGMRYLNKHKANDSPEKRSRPIQEDKNRRTDKNKTEDKPGKTKLDSLIYTEGSFELERQKPIIQDVVEPMTQRKEDPHAVENLLESSKGTMN